MNDTSKPAGDRLVKRIMEQVMVEHPGVDVLRALEGQLNILRGGYEMEQHPKRGDNGHAPEHNEPGEAFRKHNAGRNCINPTDNYRTIPDTDNYRTIP